MIIHKNLVISGRVQGVFFRHNTVKKAQELSLTGFVKNQPDGSVYCEVEGESTLVNQFIKWCYQGSSLSKVKNINITDGKIQNYSEFKITY